MLRFIYRPNYLFIRLLVVLFVFELFNSNSHAQDLDWTHGFGTGGLDLSWTIEVDKLGNVYLASTVGDSCDLDPSVNTAYALNARASISKYDNLGNYIYSFGIQGSGSVDIWDMAIGNSGNIYLVGDFKDTIDFDPDSSVYNLSNFNHRDAFIAKYTNTGQLIWAYRLSPDTAYGGETCKSIYLDDAENIALVGHYSSFMDLDPFSGVHLLTDNSFGNLDNFFIAKYDSSCNLLWANGFGNTGTDNADYVKVKDGSLYITGIFYDSVDFDPSADTMTLYANSGLYDAFFAKYNWSNGSLNWAKGIGGPNQDNGISFEIDDNANLYLLSLLWGTVDVDPNADTVELACAGRDVVLAKYDSTGSYVWAFNIGGNNNADVPVDIFLDSSNEVSVTGVIYDIADFDPDTNTELHGITSGRELFIGKYTSNGDYISVVTFGSSSNPIYLNRSAIFNENQYFVTGRFQSTIDLDPGAGTANLISAGGYDVFVAKYIQGAACSVSVSTSTTSVICNGDSTGTVTLAPSGGGIPYTYSWSNGQTDSTATGLTAGTYYVTVNDTAGCTATDSVNITEPTQIDSTVNMTICDGDSLQVGGNYYLSSGTYYDTLAAVNGCDSIVITNLTVLPDTSITKNVGLCPGDSAYAGGAYQTLPRYLL